MRDHNHAWLILASCFVILLGQGAAAIADEVQANDSSHVTEKVPIGKSSLMLAAAELDETPLQILDLEQIDEPVQVILEDSVSVLESSVVNTAVPRERRIVMPVPQRLAALVETPAISDKKFVPKGLTDGGGRFVKLDGKGRVLAGDAAQWSCVWDRDFELAWEVKTESGLRAAQHSYSFAGGAGQCLSDQCDVLQYVQAVNKEAPCGISHWRLPTKVEMQTILFHDYRAGEPSINLRFFPNTQAALYWTGVQFKYAADRVWAFDFSNGYDHSKPKTTAAHVRLVSGELRPGRE